MKFLKYFIILLEAEINYTYDVHIEYLLVGVGLFLDGISHFSGTQTKDIFFMHLD